MILKTNNILQHQKKNWVLRKEIKITCNKLDSKIILKSLLKNNAEEIFAKRVVKSIYFDTINFKMFTDSVEGLMPRKKIRIRSYPPEKKYFLEEKINFEEGRKKTTKELDINEYKSVIKKGIIDKYYGLSKPNIITNYLRRYFVVSGLRITLDTKISYSKFNNNDKIIREKFNVYEVKTDINFDDKKIDNLIGFNRSRFSKYSNAVEKLFHI